MERERKFKIIAIVCLLFAVVGITIGFAALSATLTIESTATITGASDRVFSNYIGYTAVKPCTVSGEATCEDGFLQKQVKDTEYYNLFGGINVTLNTPGDSATQKAIITNGSDYDAVLNSISTSDNAGIACFGTATNLSDVCDGVKAVVTIGSASMTITNRGVSSISGTLPMISKLNGTNEVSITISYVGTAIADSSISISIPSISVNYLTED